MMRCTLTGVDESTDVGALVSLWRAFPFVEVGVLYSPSRAGQGRYPSLGWIEDLAKTLAPLPGPPLALHLCGRAALQYLGHPIPAPGDIRRLRALAEHFPRIQLNLRAEADTPALIQTALRDHPSQQLITQHNPANERLWQALRAEERHVVLFDASGGEGRRPSTWPSPLPGKHCGYAGGLGPDNLATELTRIAAAARGQDYWVDMESSLRDDADRFSLGRALCCLSIVSRVAARPGAAASGLAGAPRL